MTKELSRIILKRFAYNVRYLRYKKGLTQKELACFSSTTQNLISMIESQQNVCLARCNNVAFSLGYPLSDLLSQDYYPENWNPPDQIRQSMTPVSL